MEELVGPGQQQIAEQDGDSLSERPRGPPPARRRVPRGEPPVHRRPAPAGVAVVQHVVVHERARVQQLERGRGGEDGRAVGPAGAAPAPVAERGPQPLAPGQRVRRGVDGRPQLGGHPGRPRPLPAGELAEHPADLVTNAIERGRRFRHGREDSRAPLTPRPANLGACRGTAPRARRPSATCWRPAPSPSPSSSCRPSPRRTSASSGWPFASSSRSRRRSCPSPTARAARPGTARCG